MSAFITELVCAARHSWQITALLGLCVVAGAFSAFGWLGLLVSITGLGLVAGWVSSFPAARQGLAQARQLIATDEVSARIMLVGQVFEPCLREALSLSPYEVVPKWEPRPLPEGFSARIILTPSQVKTLQDNLPAALQSRLAGQASLSRVEVTPDAVPGMALVSVLYTDPLAGTRQVRLHE